MTAVATDHLIRPHGGVLVPGAGERPDDVDSLETVALTSRELSDLDMLASGALSPLTGFMGRADYEGVVESMRLANGLPWALPVCLAVPEDFYGVGQFYRHFEQVNDEEVVQLLEERSPAARTSP